MRPGGTPGSKLSKTWHPASASNWSESRIGVPPGLERFERVLELVSTDAEQVAAGRGRFKAYKALGLTLNHHVMST